MFVSLGVIGIIFPGTSVGFADCLTFAESAKKNGNIE
jgi:hypothetical protein